MTEDSPPGIDLRKHPEASRMDLSTQRARRQHVIGDAAPKGRVLRHGLGVLEALLDDREIE
ncbi:MAG TPA: hypothetical protein VKB80_37365 [Kofleriaceae bacterium]|nr:hypothetical protein [Kofleriaceae bacterium]